MRRWLLVLVLALLLGSCGDRGGNAGPVLTIVSPEDQAEVTVPFTLEVSTDAELSAGDQRLQVWVDGLEGPTSTEETVQIGDLVPGAHMIHVGVTGPEGELTLSGATVQVTVTGS